MEAIVIEFDDAPLDHINAAFETHGAEIEEVAREMKPCEYCATKHYEEFIVRELVIRGLTDLSEDGVFADLME